MPKIDFQGFDKREDELRKITRFDMFSPMFYRTNLEIHAQRVHLLVRDILPIITSLYNGKFNPEKALTLALVHDDAEIITGDIQLYYKDRMSPEELAKLDQEEAEAVEKLAKAWPKKVNGFVYRDLLFHALHKDVLEAQVVSYADKIDAYCECLHEIHAGNRLFVDPAREYTDRIRAFSKKFPLLGRMLPSEHPLLSFPIQCDVEQIAGNGRPHSTNSVNEPTKFPHYTRWKQLTLQYVGQEPLTNKQE